MYKCGELIKGLEFAANSSQSLLEENFLNDRIFDWILYY